MPSSISRCSTVVHQQASSMLGLLKQASQLAYTTLVYYAAFLCYYVGQQSIGSCPFLTGQTIAEVHVYSLAKQLLLWDEPHYRAATFADDLRANLKNVAFPGTGVPLSVFCCNRATALLFVLLVNPVACLAAACYLALHKLSPSSPGSDCSSNSGHAGLAETYRQLLLAPQHWFAIWRHNCVLMGYHALVTASTSYSLEDKGTFLLQGHRLGLPVSPFYQHATVFVKHKSVEGGMGINVFKNFAAGGDWIIQPALSNSAALAALLPHDAPLSTLRVVTASIAWLQEQAAQQGGVQDSTPQHQGYSSNGGGTPQAFGSPRKQHQQQQPQSSLPGLATQDQQHMQQAAADHSGSLHHRQGQSGAASGADGAGSSSGGGGQPQVQLPIGACGPGLNTPPLPVSAGVMRPLNIEGRAGQFVDAVSSLTQHGLAHPALLPSFGVWVQRRQQQQQQNRPLTLRSKQLAAAAGQMAPKQQQQQQQTEQVLLASSSPAAVPGDIDGGGSMQHPQQPSKAELAYVDVVTAVWRAGLSGASTDHSSICFNVDLHTGALSPGVTANHWYRLGLQGLGRVDAAAGRVWQSHPDTGKQVAGCVVPGITDVLNAVLAAHMVASPDLPLVGWDVALTPEGVFILEVNLSCNLFNGAFDSASYYRLLWHYFDQISKITRAASDVRRSKAS